LTCFTFGRMYHRAFVIVGVLSISAMAQSRCPGVNFLSARTVNLKPSPTSHINVLRQDDGSYTGYEVADAAPYRAIKTTPHFEQQFAACLPHTLPVSPAGAAPTENPPGASSQYQVSEKVPSGNYLVASVNSDATLPTSPIRFDLFDGQMNLVGEKTFTSPNAEESFVALKLADLNGDGALDLIATSATQNREDLGFSVWTFLGDGDGGFQAGASQVIVQDLLAFPSANIAVGDLNGDGKPDLVVLLTGDGVPSFVLLGNGDGTFRQQNSTLGFPGPPINPAFVALADLNGDGKLDAVFLASPNGTYLASVAVALGNGDGTFQTPSRFPVLEFQGGPVTVAIGDVTGDGIPDIVTSSGSILFGDGKGGFPTRRDYTSNATGFVTLADFDGDGISDILIGNGDPVLMSGTSIYPTLTVLFGQGGGAFVAAPVSFAAVGGGIQTGQSLVAADFDGDGIPDLLITDNGDAFLAILKGTGAGDFSQVFRYDAAFPTSAVVADFNGDGKPDVAMLINQEVQVFLGNGDGTLAAPTVVSVPGARASFVGAPDLNGDGIPDLVVSGQNSVFVWVGKGGGAFSSPVSYTVQGGYLSGGDTVTLAFGDFNGDGKLDIAVPSQSPGSITLLIGKGDGTFTVGTPLPYSLPPLPIFPESSLGPTNLVAADFNGDGRLDLAGTIADYQNYYSGGFAIFLGNGDGTFQPPFLNTEPATGIAAADLNGDRILDMIVTGNTVGTVVLLGSGDGAFQSGMQILTEPFQAMAVADFNRDGTLDVAGGLVTIGVAAFLNLSQPPPALAVVPAPTFAPGPLAPDSIASAFGKALTTQTNAPNQNPPPTTVLGNTVTVVDSTGASRLAPLFYVSPDQINFLVPPATAVGPVTITVNSDTGRSFAVHVQIAPTAPGLFTVGNAGIAAAYVTQVVGNTQTTEPVFTVQSGSIVPVPINLDQDGQAYLILFGTGFDAAGHGSTSATVQGVSATVEYVGSQELFPGLDQANILLPPSLAGSGIVSVVLTIDGTAANTVYITIQ
jgi:uncharacterized protein (TIGR03437 family)